MVGQRGGDLDLQAINTVVALVDGLRPENELEAAVAVQIGLTHQLSLEMLRHVVNAHCLEHKERYANLATKLQRTMTTQIDTLTKLRRGPEPRLGRST